MIPITAVVVSYNTKDLLRRCLESLHDVNQVIVVDNNSHDGSADLVRTEFPHCELIANSANLGFGRANNQGIAKRRHEAILLLNSDAAAEPGAVAHLHAALTVGVVAVGGGLITEGKLVPSAANELTLGRLFCEQFLLEKLLPGSALDSYWVRSETATEVPQVMGACLLFRPVEVFDERYKLYCEDTDLCFRLRKQGRILYVPEARFTHELGSSSAQDRSRSVALYNRGKELYFGIHHGPAALWAALVLNRLGALLRLIIGLGEYCASFGKKSARLQTFAKVLVAPLRGPELR